MVLYTCLRNFYGKGKDIGMRNTKAFLLIAASLALPIDGSKTWADAPPTQPEEIHNKTDPGASLGYFEALVLGLVEGITEYLPISSTGHLILANEMLGLTKTETPQTEDSVDFENALEARTVTESSEAAYSLEKAANAYVIIIQGGAILAVIMLYWGKIIGIIQGLLGKNPQGLRLGLLVLTGFMPAALLGPFLDAPIEKFLFGPGPVAAALIVGAFVMFAMDWRDRKNRRLGNLRTDPPLEAMTFPQALFIGILQCVAMWPGTSRSMMTIVGGMLIGLSARRAAEFSFLLGLLTLSAASCYKLLKEGEQVFAFIELGPALFGIFVSFVSALLAIRWLVNFLTRHGLAIFAVYRLIIGGLIILYLV
jgi:undecaprenyl-diphosphatase